MRRRNAFTIVELLVAMALIMFIMSILSTAFVTATTLFRNLKAVGDMANKLRSVTTLLQRDLAANHFEGTKRLSDPNFWVNGPPTQGFFRIWQGSQATPAGPLDFIEGVNPPQLPPYSGIPDLDGIYSYRSVDHMLAFTVKLRGVQMGDFMTAGPHGGGTVLGAITTFGPAEARYQMANNYNYQWAEVAWFLQAQIDPNTGIQDTTSGGYPLWTLYRNQRLAVPDNTLVPGPHTHPAKFLEVSSWLNPNTNTLYFNSPMDLTVPTRRFGMVPTNPSGLLYATPSFPTGLWPLPPPNGPWTPPNANGSPDYTPPYTPYYPTLAQQGAPGNLVNADIQATDVVSFDVRILVPDVAANLMSSHFNRSDPFVTLFTMYPGTTTSAFATPPPVPPPALPFPNINYLNGNPSFSAAADPRVFDTWTSLTDQYTNYAPQFPTNYSQWNVAGHHASIPLWNATTQMGPIIQAIQITIRVWDMKTEQTREVTIVQAM